MEREIKRRRRHSAQFKAEVLAACALPGAAVAEVARRYEINDNMVHAWLRGRGVGAGRAPVAAPSTAPSFIALALPSQAPAPAQLEAAPIRLELQRGATTVKVSWPGEQARACAAWLREVLR